jgi:hypothetical protein
MATTIIVELTMKSRAISTVLVILWHYTLPPTAQKPPS